AQRSAMVTARPPPTPTRWTGLRRVRQCRVPHALYQSASAKTRRVHTPTAGVTVCGTAVRHKDRLFGPFFSEDYSRASEAKDACLVGRYLAHSRCSTTWLDDAKIYPTSIPYRRG